MTRLLSNQLYCALLAVVLGLGPGAALAQKVVKLGHFGPGPDPFSKSVVAFAKKVEELSAGSLKVQVYPAGQLGNEKQQLGALQGGLQELLVTSTSNLTAINEPFKLLDLPFAFASYAEADAVTMGPFADKLMARLPDSKLVGLALWENGFRVVSNSRRPITKLADFQGLKMRVIGAPVFIDTFKALGTNPVPLPFPELFSALETKTVDGQDNPVVAVQAVKFYEVQRHLTLTNHMYGAMVVLAGKPFHDRLSDKERDILRRAAAEFGPEQRQILREASDKSMAFLAGEGKMEIVKALGKAELAAIRAAVKPVVDNNVSDGLRPLYAEMNAQLDKAGR